MGQRYWVVGGEYRDCQFDEVVPGTEEISGPFPDCDRARTEWQRLTFRDRARRHHPLRDHARSRAGEHYPRSAAQSPRHRRACRARTRS